jgi:hypothetical protein
MAGLDFNGGVHCITSEGPFLYCALNFQNFCLEYACIEQICHWHFIKSYR